VDEGERLRVMAALAAAGGTSRRAAVKLGVSRRAFYRLLERLGA
jgi:DNA-binding NtrC family response regulator